MRFTIDIDTGGTFTDGFFFHDDRALIVKVPTTPHDLTVCFLECIKAGATKLGMSIEELLFDTEIIRFSNTIGTNTIIQRTGSKIGLLVTAEKECEAPTGHAEDKSPLVDPDMVMGVAEQVSAQGEVVTVPDQEVTMRSAQDLIDRGARCLVVAFENSHVNPANERSVRAVVKREYPRDFLGSVPVFLSSDISFRSDWKARMNAAIISAYIHGKLAGLLYKAEEELRARHYHGTLFIGHNNAAVARVAKTRAINTYNSGPAAGLSGTAMISDLYGLDGVISGDMGGTSFDLGYVRDGAPCYSLDTDIEGFVVNVPMINIQAIGAGGGSIAEVKGSKVKVGPQSAGALPGPVCFDLGGMQPTVTDADLILGLINPDNFLGGGMKLNGEKARQILQERIAAPLGVSIEEAALLIRRRIDDTIGNELAKLKHAVFKDAEPALLVFGGAGPGHCADIARVAGIRKVIVAPFSSVFSAFSSSTMDIGHVYYQEAHAPFPFKENESVLYEKLDGLKTRAERDMRGEGFSTDGIEVGLEMFFENNGSETRICRNDLEIRDPKSLDVQAKRELGLEATDQLILSGVGLRVTAPAPHYSIKALPEAKRPVEDLYKADRSVFLNRASGYRNVPVYDLDGLGAAHSIKGPSLVESDYTTVFVPEDWSLNVNHYGHLVLEEVH